MNNQHSFTDEELAAFLDGELDDALAAEIHLARSNDVNLDTRIVALSVNTAGIRSAFDTLLQDAPAMPELPIGVQQPRGWLGIPVRGAIAAVALLCLLLGGLVGSYLPIKPAATWQDFAATYHALYVNATLSEVHRSPEITAAELARVSEALGKKLEFRTVSAVKQLDFKRSQILGFQGQPLIQLAFLSKVGAPVALCIIRSDKAGETELKRSTIRGMKAVTWSKNEFEFLLIGGSDASLLDEAATNLAKRL